MLGDIQLAVAVLSLCFHLLVYVVVNCRDMSYDRFLDTDPLGWDLRSLLISRMAPTTWWTYLSHYINTPSHVFDTPPQWQCIAVNYCFRFDHESEIFWAMCQYVYLQRLTVNSKQESVMIYFPFPSCLGGFVPESALCIMFRNLPCSSGHLLLILLSNRKQGPFTDRLVSIKSALRTFLRRS